VRGTVYRRCWCRNPDTKRPYTAEVPCPKLKARAHGKWYARYDSATEHRRQPILGPFEKKTDAEEELTAAIAREGGGAGTRDRNLRVAAYLEAYLAGKRKMKDSSRAADAEAFRLYWVPALGKMRLVDVRDSHVSAVITEMLRVNRPAGDGGQPSEMLRRMLAARADDARRELPKGDARHKKSTKPLSPARVVRVFAPFRAAMNAAVKTKKIDVSPCLGVEPPDADEVKPLAWTPAREAKFRAALARRTGKAEAAAKGKRRALTTVERQALWAAGDLRPCPVMVWMPAHTGEFLDYLDTLSERLAPLFVVAAFCGFRRDEILGLKWSEVDLDGRAANVRETGSGSGPKSKKGIRSVPLPPPVVTSLAAWRERQEFDRLVWGPDWPDTDLVFTREDGSPVPAQWTSTRFEILAYRSGVPPVRFHDLRHGTASLLKAAGVDTKVISAILGHSKTSFTDSVYVTLFPEIEQAASDAAAAVVPRRRPAKAEEAP
jgi:integrase